jgi:hypothetical protein
MGQRIIVCPKHGRVVAPCRICKVHRFIKRVKAGLACPRPFEEGPGPTRDDISPLQIRFRAFMQRTQRETNKKGKRWRQKTRLIYCYSSELLEEQDE